MLKLKKEFECSCIDGYTGDFCEFKTEQYHLLFLSRYLDSEFIKNPPMVFNADGRLMEENAVIDEQAGALESCSTMLNGEAIIFGGNSPDFVRQVHFK